jgi:hypothetical protein
MKQNLLRIWNDIRHGENIELYAAITLALILAVLNLVGVTAPDKLISSLNLVVLGSLAYSLLKNRYHFEDLSNKLSSAFLSKGFRDRSELHSFRDRGQFATEVVIVGVSLISAVRPHLDYFEGKMRAGCKLRFLLLDPESPSVVAWNLMSKISSAKQDIELTLGTLRILLKMEKTTAGKCEVRLSQSALPFGIAAFDPSKELGSMTVELQTYKKTLGERPHIELIRQKDAHWFEFFESQYEQLWADSAVWTSSDT